MPGANPVFHLTDPEGMSRDDRRSTIDAINGLNREQLSSVGDPLHNENMLNGRGRGLYFMEHMADELHLEKKGRLLRLVFYRDSDRSV